MATLIAEEHASGYADKGNYGSGKGWKYVWHPEDPKEYYHFETLECLYKYAFEKQGLIDFLKERAWIPQESVTTSSHGLRQSMRVLS